MDILIVVACNVCEDLIDGGGLIVGLGDAANPILGVLVGDKVCKLGDGGIVRDRLHAMIPLHRKEEEDVGRSQN